MNSSMFIFCLTLWLFNCAFSDSDESADESERYAQTCLADKFEPWSYRGDNGPMHWGEIYEQCHGLRQSPISIDTGRVDRRIRPHWFYLFYYNPITNLIVRNNGHTVQGIIEDNIWRWFWFNSSIYNLREIHFHWGRNDAVGSEHVIDGVRYPMEMHLVHQNNENHTAVVAILFEAVEEINAEMQHIVNTIPQVMYKDTQIRMRYRLDLYNMLSENPITYFQYNGSLTTPECTEGVTWFVVKTPNHIGRSQLQEFRKLFSSPQNMTESGCRLSDNFRHLQYLNRRAVWASYDKSDYYTSA